MAEIEIAESAAGPESRGSRPEWRCRRCGVAEALAT